MKYKNISKESITFIDVKTNEFVTVKPNEVCELTEGQHECLKKYFEEFQVKAVIVENKPEIKEEKKVVSTKKIKGK